MRFVSHCFAVLGWGWISVLTGCEPPPPEDRRPPQLIDTRVSPSGQELTLEFDEPVAQASTGGDFSPRPPEATVAGETVSVGLPGGLKPGRGYHWTAEVTDAGQNVTSVQGKFYGPNAHPAALRLNEVRIAGSGAHTDLVELRVEAPGSLGGWTLDAYGTPARQRFILPDCSVAQGDFVVVHLKPAGLEAEKDETSLPDASGGAEAEPQAWDFWLREGKGLSAVKGAVVLRPRPDAAPTDALLYGKNPGDGDPLAAAAGWTGREQLNPEGATATRTWSRTDETPPRWILTANGGATPGKANKLTPWAGPTSSRKAVSKSKGRRVRRRRSANSARPDALGSTPSRGAAADPAWLPRVGGEAHQSETRRDNPGRRGRRALAHLGPNASRPPAGAPRGLGRPVRGRGEAPPSREVPWP
jgi:hypothetical protein